MGIATTMNIKVKTLIVVTFLYTTVFLLGIVFFNSLCYSNEINIQYSNYCYSLISDAISLNLNLPISLFNIILLHSIHNGILEIFLNFIFGEAQVLLILFLAFKISKFKADNGFFSIVITFIFLFIFKELLIYLFLSNVGW